MKEETNKKQCPCCGFYTLPLNSIFESCDICDWEDDELQSDDPDFAHGSNRISLNDYRAQWLKEHHRQGLDSD